MSKFLKHVGKHNGKPVIVVQRAIPGEDHMAAVIYSSNLPAVYQEVCNRLLDSSTGQDSKEFMHAMQSVTLQTGEPLIPAMVREGFIKKAQNSQIIMTPNSNSAIRLDELNDLLKKAGDGEEAIRKLEAMDREVGRHDPLKKNAPISYEAPTASPVGQVLDDDRIAATYRSQAVRMRREAETLIAEAERLELDAASLVGVPESKSVNTSTENKKRGRPKKVTV